MDKKGVDSRSILWTFYIILVIIITVFLYNQIETISSGKGFSDRYFVNDIGLTFDTISSANYDLELKHNVSQTVSLKMSEGKITLNGGGLEYNYVMDNNLNIPYGNLNLDENKILVINKKNNVVDINIKENEAR